MQLTKDEIEALIAASYEPAEHGVKLNGEKLVRDAIATHTAKVLEDVEPGAWLDRAVDWDIGGKPITRRMCIQTQCGNLALSYVEDALRVGDSTVAALKSERDALAARVAELEKDAGRLDYIEENARCEPKMDGHHVWWPTTFSNQLKGPNLRAAIDAALTAKG